MGGGVICRRKALEGKKESDRHPLDNTCMTDKPVQPLNRGRQFRVLPLTYLSQQNYINFIQIVNETARHSVPHLLTRRRTYKHTCGKRHTHTHRCWLTVKTERTKNTRKMPSTREIFSQGRRNGPITVKTCLTEARGF